MYWLLLGAPSGTRARVHRILEGLKQAQRRLLGESDPLIELLVKFLETHPSDRRWGIQELLDALRQEAQALRWHGELPANEEALGIALRELAPVLEALYGIRVVRGHGRDARWVRFVRL